ncbi:MAG: hypothetical protein RL113_295 [Pseudomonadota bacterium]
MSVAAIFAGGKSSRMGKDKALLPFGGHTTLAAFQYTKLKRYFDAVYLSAKEDKFDFDAPTIADQYSTHSPLSGLITLFETLPDEEIFILSVDAPFVDQAVIEKILNHAKYTKGDAIIAQTPSGLQPLCGLYRRSILPLAKAQLEKDNHKMQDLLALAKSMVVLFEEESDFANLNHPQEYDEALKSFKI